MDLAQFADYGTGVLGIVILAYMLKLMFEKFDESNKRCEKNSQIAREEHKCEREEWWGVQEKREDRMNTTLIGMQGSMDGLTKAIEKQTNRRRKDD